MTEQELKVMEASLGTLEAWGLDVWRRAFAEYNEQHPTFPLNRACRSCFAKVLSWHKKQTVET